MISQRLVCLTLAAFVLGGGAASAADKKVLVYTRNYTPDGKGYVHDNIATSVDAIKKMGAENGFAVDASDDPEAVHRRQSEAVRGARLLQQQQRGL